MNMNITNQASIIERNIHCPFCDKDEALLLHELTGQRSTLQYPDFGKKFWLRIVFTFGISAIVHGLPFCEIKRSYDHVTYGFCPHCGNSFNASCPDQMQKKEPKLYRRTSNKIVMGIASGIAAYTDLPLLLIRAVMILYALMIALVESGFMSGLMLAMGIGSVSGPVGFIISVSSTALIAGVLYMLATFLIPTDPDENW